MAYYLKKMEKELSASRIEVHNDVVGPPYNASSGRVSPGPPKEQEKKIRREIANSNERRRMQSINSGFQSLRTLLPNHEGEKLSKAAILQQTSDYIYRLEQEKTTLLNQVVQLKRLLKKYERMEDTDAPSPKRRKRVDSMMDEGIGSPESMEDALPTNKPHEDVRRDIIELRCQLDRERRYRMVLEEQNRTLESQLYPEKLKELAKQIQIQGNVFQDRKLELEVAAAQQQQQMTMMIQYQVPQPQAPQALPVITPTTSTTSQQNLDTIVQAIRHLEGDKTTPGSTPVQTPSHTPTPDDEARKQRDDAVEQASSRLDVVCRRPADPCTREADNEVDHYTSQQQQILHVELVHPVDRLTTRPMSASQQLSTSRITPQSRPSIIVS